jgi:hypothetical protein
VGMAGAGPGVDLADVLVDGLDVKTGQMHGQSDGQTAGEIRPLARRPIAQGANGRRNRAAASSWVPAGNGVPVRIGSRDSRSGLAQGRKRA